MKLIYSLILALALTLSASAQNLAGTLATPSGVQNLMALGTNDWAHWGLTTATSFDHKAGVTALISNYTVVGTGAPTQYADNGTGYTWTGGTPTATATGSTTGVFIAGLGNGFKITAPADTTQRTLTVYVDAYHAQGKIVAHLSDSSSLDYVSTGLNSATTAVQGAFTFIYKAASSGQTLTVTYTNSVVNVADGNVALQAATLVVSVAHQTVLTITPPIAQAGVTVTSYNIYKSLTSGGYTKGTPYATVPVGSGTVNFTDPAIAGQKTFFTATAVCPTCTTPESNFAPEISGTTPNPATPTTPNVPGLSGIWQ